MSKEKYLSKAGRTFKHKEWITSERKTKIEKHPDATSHFIFKHAGSGYNWFVRV